MSYSFNSKCFNCKKQPKCSDGNILAGAISVIHSNGQDKGHLGGGSVTHECQNFEPKE